jgi:hypothetical protein
MYGHVIAPISLISSSSSSSTASCCGDDGNGDDCDGAVTSSLTVDEGDTSVVLRSHDAAQPSVSSSKGTTSSSTSSRVVCTPQDQFVVAATQLPTSLAMPPQSSSSANVSDSTSRLLRQSPEVRDPRAGHVGTAPSAHCDVLPSAAPTGEVSLQPVAGQRKRVRVMSPPKSLPCDAPSVPPLPKVTTSGDKTSGSGAQCIHLSQLDYNAAADSSGGSSCEDEVDDAATRRRGGAQETAGDAFYDVNPSSIRFYLALGETRMVPTGTLPFASLVAHRAVEALQRFDEALWAATSGESAQQTAAVV